MSFEAVLSILPR